MYAYNKTTSWLDNKTQEERESIINKARNEAPKLRHKFKTRFTEIKRLRLEAVREQIRKNEEAAQRKIQQLENLTTDVIFYGLWHSKADIDANMAALNTKSEKEAALKA